MPVPSQEGERSCICKCRDIHFVPVSTIFRLDFGNVLKVCGLFCFYYIHVLSSNKGIFVWPIWTEVKLSIFSYPGKITGYWITKRSFPYRGPYWSEPIWASTSSQANMCVSFSRCRKYVINNLIHGHFHFGLVITPRPILDLDSVSGQYGGLGMITRPIRKCPCINLFFILRSF